MKITRHIFTLAAVLATLCGIAIAALWIWIWNPTSERFYNSFEERRILGNICFTAFSHTFGLEYISEEIVIDPPIDPPQTSRSRPYDDRFLVEIIYPDSHLGFRAGIVRVLSEIHYYQTFNETHYFTKHCFFVPFWLCFPLLLWFPLMLLHRHHRFRRLGKDLCRNCHYDLRAHQPGQKCPECGRVIEAQP